MTCEVGWGTIEIYEYDEDTKRRIKIMNEQGLYYLINGNY